MYKDETWERLEAANAAGALAVGREHVAFTVAERDQIDALARDLDRELQRYPVIHAWPASNGSQLAFWCIGCETEHVHGRHIGRDYCFHCRAHHAHGTHPPAPGCTDCNYCQVETKLLARRSFAPVARQADQGWRRQVAAREACEYNPNVPGGRGFCTCPIGSGDGHRVAHCYNTASPYYAHGYILHEVEPNDARALTKPMGPKPR